MASLASNLRKATEIVATLSAMTVPMNKVGCTVYEWGEIEFLFVEPVDMVRVFNVLNARKQSLETFESEKYLHISFRARGAKFKTAILKPKVAEFYAAIGATLKPKLTFAPMGSPANATLGLPAPKGGAR